MLIYLIENKTNGKKYIGQTTCTTEKRWQEHINNARCANPARYNYPLYLAIRKYGPESFSISVLDTADSQEELNEKEIRYIREYRTLEKPFGYNRHEGGNKPPASTPESRRKAGLAIKGRPFSEEHRRKISEALTGKKLSLEHRAKMIGRKASEEARRHMSESGGWWKGRKQSPEHTEKIRQANTGRPCSEETKKKLSEYFKKNPPKVSPEGAERKRQATIRRWEREFIKTVAWG